MNNLIEKGEIGNKKAQILFVENGFSVYIPFIDNGIDFIIKKEDEFISFQTKTALKLGNKYKRASFRFGNEKEVPQYVICLFNEDYWIIPRSKINTVAFQINPDSTRSKYSKYKNNIENFKQWQEQNKINEE